jgi:hypothetical protein
MLFVLLMLKKWNTFKSNGKSNSIMIGRILFSELKLFKLCLIIDKLFKKTLFAIIYQSLKHPSIKGTKYISIFSYLNYEGLNSLNAFAGNIKINIYIFLSHNLFQFRKGVKMQTSIIVWDKNVYLKVLFVQITECKELKLLIIRIFSSLH